MRGNILGAEREYGPLSGKENGKDAVNCQDFRKIPVSNKLWALELRNMVFCGGEAHVRERRGRGWILKQHFT